MSDSGGDVTGSITLDMTAPFTGFAMQYWAEQLVPAIQADEGAAEPVDDPIDFSCLNITEY